MFFWYVCFLWRSLFLATVWFGIGGFSHQIMKLFDKLVPFLGDAGLKLNADKMVLITPQTRPPPCLTTSESGWDTCCRKPVPTRICLRGATGPSGFSNWQRGVGSCNPHFQGVHCLAVSWPYVFNKMQAQVRLAAFSSDALSLVRR